MTKYRELRRTIIFRKKKKKCENAKHSSSRYLPGPHRQTHHHLQDICVLDRELGFRRKSPCPYPEETHITKQGYLLLMGGMHISPSPYQGRRKHPCCSITKCTCVHLLSKLQKFPQGGNDKMVPISSGDLSLKKKLLNPHGQQMTMIVKKGQSTQSQVSLPASPTRPTRNKDTDENFPRQERGEVPESWLKCFPAVCLGTIPLSPWTAVFSHSM